MPSQFYKDKFEHNIPLTGLFTECLGHGITEAGGNLEGPELVEVFARAMTKAGLVEGAPTDEQVQFLVEQVEEHHRIREEMKEPPKDLGDGKHFLGYFSKWASEMEYDKLCFYVADYDYTKARDYFEKHDQRSILAIAEEKLRLDFELARVSFEAALFGFGGGYKNTPREGDSVFDLTEDSKSAENALKSMGF